MTRNSINTIIKLKGNIKAETARAIMFTGICEINGCDAYNVVQDERSLNDQWFPLSQVHKIFRSNEIDQDELHVNEWICKQKGLVE